MKKHSIWLSIATLALCFGVMAFGVYSAVNSSLNVSGSLGFVMHDCMVEMSGTIYNLAEGVTDTNASATLGNREIEKTVLGGESTTTNNFALDDMYFYYGVDSSTDQAKMFDIVFQITFKNVLTSAVTISAPKPTVANATAISVLDSTNNSEYTTFPYSTTINAGESTTIMFALRLNDSSALTDKVALTWTGITFEEWSLMRYDSTNNYYYIELGTNPDVQDQSGNNVPLRWIPYAESTDGTTFSIFDSASEPKAGNTYYFISEYVLSADGGGTAMANYGLSYCNDYYSFPTNNYAHNTYQSGSVYISAHNYATSNLRAYFKSTSSNQVSQYYKANSSDSKKYEPDTSVQINFLDRFGISSDYLYQNKEKYGITARSLSELYTTDKNSVDYATFENTFKTSNPELFTDDYFWAPSLAELTYVNGVEGTNVASGTTYDNLIAYQSYDGGNTAAAWWSRSPFSSGGSSAYCVLKGGNVNGNYAYSRYGARPAFQITIPA